MRGNIPPLPNTPSLCGAQLKKHRATLSFTMSRLLISIMQCSDPGTIRLKHLHTAGFMCITVTNLHSATSVISVLTQVPRRQLRRMGDRRHSSTHS
jgi:hypothetical protein